jgi:hypothetical protein
MFLFNIKLCGYLRKIFCTSNPDVIIDFIYIKGHFYISIKNIGQKPAYRVSVKFDNKIIGVEGTKEISSMPLFQNIEFLPPSREIRTFLDTSASYFNGKNPTKINANITFFDSYGIKHENLIKHNLEIYKDIGFIDTSSI